MKCRNTITGYIFEIGIEECKKLFSDFNCFELVEADKDEIAQLANTKEKKLSIRQKVMKTERKEY